MSAEEDRKAAYRWCSSALQAALTVHQPTVAAEVARIIKAMRDAGEVPPTTVAEVPPTTVAEVPKSNGKNGHP